METKNSLQSRLIRPMLQLQRLAQRNASIPFTRRLSRWTERVYSIPKDVQWVKATHSDLPSEWLIPKETHSEDVIFYIHGGGFVFPLYNPSRYTTAHLVRLAGMRAFLVEYRLAPEFPFPAAVEDCAAAYRWLLSTGKVSPKQVMFAGESAGGNLVITTLLKLRDAGIPLPKAAISICPVFDFEGRGSFYQQDDPMVDAGFVMRQFNAYRGNTDPHDPYLSPLHADLRGLPPLLIQIGGDEILRSGAEELALRVEKAGVPTTLEIYPGMWHFWHLFTPFLPEAEHAMQQIARFLQRYSGS